MRRSLLLLALPLILLLAGCHVVGPERVAVFFSPRSSELDAQARQVVATIAERARQRPGAAVVVSGFADPIGPADDNLALSERRAQAVVDALAAAGLDPARVKRRAIGGVDYTLDSIESRRVEITLGEE
jgi:outer membrane protein OmpA-like peptidoglycan-associated protein